MKIELPDDLAERLAALAAAHGKDINRYAVAALTEIAERAEAQQLPDETAPPFDAAAIRRKYAAKYAMPDLSHLSDEDLAEQTEAIITQMAPDTRVEMERQGLL